MEANLQAPPQVAQLLTRRWGTPPPRVWTEAADPSTTPSSTATVATTDPADVITSIPNSTWLWTANTSTSIAAASSSSSGDFAYNVTWLATGENATLLYDGGDGGSSPSPSSIPPAPQNYWAAVLVLCPLLTVFGNVLVIASVARERSLQSVTNYFIVSLAVADLLVAALVMPFAVYVLVNGSWALPAFVCDFYIAMDVTCSTSSILNLVAISVDRYMAVTRPIQYAKHKNRRRVWLTIALVWAISAAIGSPIILGLNQPPDVVLARDQPPPDEACGFYNSDFIIYSSLSSFYIPCLIMVYLYYQIFKAIRERAKKAAATRKPHPSEIKPGSVIENVAQTKRLAETALSSGVSAEGSGIVESLKSSGKSGLGGQLTPSAGVVLLKPASAYEEDKPTNTGSGSQDDDDDDDLDDDNEGIVAAAVVAGIAECHVIANSQTDLAMEPVGDDDVEHADAEEDEEDGDGTSPGASLRHPSPSGLGGGDGAGVVNGNNDSGYAASTTVEFETVAQVPSPSLKTRTHASTVAKGALSLAASIPVRGGDGKERKQQSSGSRFTIYKAHKASRKKRERSAAKKERKATKTLAIVLGVFLFCWVPFFTCNILDAVCSKLGKNCGLGLPAFLLTTWLGYMNSFVNPVIYTIFNSEFRKAFKKILRIGS